MLLSHGSPTPAWNGHMHDLQQDMATRLGKESNITGVKSAFMECTVPTIATTLKAFDAEGYTDVIVLPLFVAQGMHSLNDIPNLLGIQTDPVMCREHQEEGFEPYRPQASVTYGPSLERSGIYTHNVLNRVSEASLADSSSGILMVAYGSRPYISHWNDVFTRVSCSIEKQCNKKSVDYTWFGFITRFNPEVISTKIDAMLEHCSTVTVVPMVLSASEMYLNVIAQGVKGSQHPDRVHFERSSIFPDPAINQWVEKTARDIAAIIAK